MVQPGQREFKSRHCRSPLAMYFSEGTLLRSQGIVLGERGGEEIPAFTDLVFQWEGTINRGQVDCRELSEESTEGEETGGWDG